jgi:ribonuclease H / adenosylcobalamin/alpha-ribazole phosphatase
LIVILARHAESVLNAEGRVNGDPAVPAGLTDHGRDEARLLGAQLAHLEVDLCVHSRFQRTRETAELALAGRDVPVEVEPLLDDIRIGELEGLGVARYREAKRGLGRRDPFPGGESLDDAARRYARAFTRIVERHAGCVLVVTHEIPVRYALNGAAGSAELDGPPFHDIPNAVPYLFERAALERAAGRIEDLAGA